ncbi:DUF6223 family protein [Saccharothrix sp. BKS2]|uniref:DUF6223 family protein n=1 Tax=Saccharothrix sp. BKS2 TaxID=3064400 RepID=UPI0039EBD490
MSVCDLVAVATARFGGTALAEPVPGLPSAADAYAMGAGRTAALPAGLLGLAGVVLGWRAVSRAGRGGAVAAVVSGVAGAVLGGVVVVTAEGGLGTGNGLGGGVVAAVVGLVGAVLGGLALARARRAAAAGASRAG